jgi:hypothetical protein
MIEMEKILESIKRDSDVDSRWCSGLKSPLSNIMRVLFLDYGLPPLRRAALLARRLVRSSVQLAVVPSLLLYVANFRD